MYGGVPKKQQRQALRRGAHVVIATPGRLLDLVREGACDLSAVKCVVLDEADRMLDLGFEEDIKAIMSSCPPKAERQTVMFSATWPEAVRAIANTYQRKPVRVVAGSEDLTANHRVTQTVEVLDPREKERRLDQLLHEHHKARGARVLVFALYKKEASRLEQALSRRCDPTLCTHCSARGSDSHTFPLFPPRRGWKVGAIHGDRSQEERTRALDAFTRGTTPILVATDVAARGLGARLQTGPHCAAGADSSLLQTSPTWRRSSTTPSP